MKKNITCKKSPTLKGLIIQSIYASETSAQSTDSYMCFSPCKDQELLTKHTGHKKMTGFWIIL